MSWFLQASASRVKQACTSLTKKAKVNADYYVKQLLPKLLDGCHQLLGQRFIIHHAAKVNQQWLAAHCPDFIDKDSMATK